jgi:hypothetical protein
VQKKFLPPKTSTKGVQPMKQSVIVKSTLAVILAALTLTTHSQAQTGILAQPVGIFTVPVVGPKKLNLLATPFARPAVAQGTISAQSGSILTVTQVPAMASDTPYILEILDGDYIGVVSLVTASTGSTVTIQYTLPDGAIASGTRYGIRPDWTVAELFGPAATSQIGSSTSFGNGDQIQIFNPVTQQLENVYRLRTGTTPNFTYAWMTQGGVSADNVRVPLGEGFIVYRFASSTVNLRLSGELRQSRTRKEILGGQRLNVVSNPNPYAVKLSQSGLITSSGSNPAAADNVHFVNPNTGAFVSYYRNSGLAGRWTAVDGSDASNVTIPAGGSIVIQRKSGSGDLLGTSALKLNPIPYASAPGI